MYGHHFTRERVLGCVRPALMSSRARIAGGARGSEGVQLRNPVLSSQSGSRGKKSRTPSDIAPSTVRDRVETFLFRTRHPLSAAGATYFWQREDPSIMELRHGRVSLVVLGRPMVRTPRDLHPKGMHTPKNQRSRLSKTRRFYT